MKIPDLITEEKSQENILMEICSEIQENRGCGYINCCECVYYDIDNYNKMREIVKNNVDVV